MEKGWNHPVKSHQRFFFSVEEKDEIMKQNV